MNINLTCDCGAQLKLPPENAGQTATCPKCGRIHAVPGHGVSLPGQPGMYSPLPPVSYGNTVTQDRPPADPDSTAGWLIGAIAVGAASGLMLTWLAITGECYIGRSMPLNVVGAGTGLLLMIGLLWRSTLSKWVVIAAASLLAAYIVSGALRFSPANRAMIAGVLCCPIGFLLLLGRGRASSIRTGTLLLAVTAAAIIGKPKTGARHFGGLSADNSATTLSAESK